MKNKMINAAICDARNVAEESLSGFDRIAINAAILIVGERAKELLNKYLATMNVANVIEVPDGRNIWVKSIDGKGEIGPDSDGTDVFLMVNGKLTIKEGSEDAAKSYHRNMVNGKVLMPKSYEGKLPNLQIDGKTELYPDGATILKANTQVDDLFAKRASNTLYYCSGNIFFLDAKMDAKRILAKGIRFTASRIVIAESLMDQMVSAFDEEAEIIRVPDGARLIDDDIELKPKTIKKYGDMLCVAGDVLIRDAEALSSLKYLFVDGTVTIHMDLKEAFDEIEAVYDDLKVIDPEQGCLSDRPLIKVGTAVLKKYPHGVRIEDCAKVKLAEDLSLEEIMGKMKISDCTKEQEEAVNMIAEDVAMIKVQRLEEEDENQNGMVGGMLGSFLGKMKDGQVINAAEYKM